MTLQSAQMKAASTLVEKRETNDLWQTFSLVRLPELRDEINLYNFQQYAIYKSLNQPVFIMGMQTGLGKTPCSLATYFYYCSKYPGTKLIVVCNKSATLQFRSEIDKFFDHDKRVLAMHQRMPKLGAKTYPNARKNALEMFADTETNQKLDAMIMNYAIFRLEHETIKKACVGIRTAGKHLFVIYDECTAFANFHKTHRAVKSISTIANRALGTTATMTKGKLEQIYGIFSGMNMQLYQTKRHFEDAHCIVWRHPKRPYITNVSGYKDVGTFVDKIKPVSIVLKKSDVASQLPAFTVKREYLEHSKEQIRMITDIYSGHFDVANYEEDPDFAYTIEEVKDNPFADTELDPGSEEWDGRQIVHAITSTGFIKMALLDHNCVLRKPNIKQHSPKTERILEMLQEEFTDEKIVIYTHSRRYLVLLAETIAKFKATPSKYKNVLMIHGGISEKLRQEGMDLFSNSDMHNIILINRAGLESINLQAANTIICTTLPASGGDLIQLAGRISRINTEHTALFMIYLLMEDSQDEDEYLIDNEQMAITSPILGEAEQGLIDWDYLREKKSRNLPDVISKAEYQEKSKTYHILSKRKKRAQKYLNKLIKA